jgi:hypothetical protein
MVVLTTSSLPAAERTEGGDILIVEVVPAYGNAFSIIGAVANALKSAGNSREDVDAVREEMMEGDYNHLLQVAFAVTTDDDSDY